VILDPSDGSLDGFSGWTAEAWINLSALPVDGYATLVKKDQGYICRLVESLTCTNCYYAQAFVWAPAMQFTSWAMPTAPATGTWNHLACAYSNGTVTIYWDGSAVSSSPGGTGAFTNVTTDLGLGADPIGIENLQGSVDDFKMWTRARTDQEICADACGTYLGTSCTFDGICGN
jgi:hypothetical protein